MYPTTILRRSSPQLPHANGQVAAIMLEPLQGEGGVNPGQD